jgi:hypothetical protein
MATNYEVRYSTEQNEWLFWDDVNNQFADPQPTLATALAGENLIVLNSDAPGGFFFSGCAGSDVYNVQAGFAQNVLLSDPLHGQGSFNILRFDADVELVSAEIVDFPEIASSELQIVLKVSEAVSVTITVRSLDGMRFQVGGAVTPIYTAQELVQNFAVVANLPADAVFEDSAYSYDMSATADGTVAPVAVGTALVANDRNGDEVAYRLAADAPAGFMVSDQGQILFTGLATDLTETLYTFEVIATSLGADETLTDVRQLVSVRLVVERTFQGSSDVDVFDLSARQDNLIVEGGDGSDILTMGSGHDIVTGGLGNDKIDLSAGGSDRLHGLGGDDTIVGGEHSESLYGGAGNDTLTGSGGADRFVYQYVNAGDDTITDFNAAEGDVIDISHSLQGAPTRDNISDYVSFAASTGTAGITFSVSVDGASDANGVDYSFTIEGRDANNFDLAAMVDSGALDIV